MIVRLGRIAVALFALAFIARDASSDPDSTAISSWPTSAQVRSQLLHGAGTEGPLVQEKRPRSVPLAAALSAVVPGLGQAYNGDWIRSALALAVESGLVIGYFLSKNRGEAGEDAYQEYAHAHWSPARYATWLSDYVRYLEQRDGEPLPAPDIEVPMIDFSRPETWTPAERSAVRAFFNDVRDVEDVVYHPETGARFSHNLPYFSEQQYYELIGKYYQFAPGWTDYPAWKEGDIFTDAIDPERTGPGGSKPNVRGRFLEYAEDHAEANDLLRRASRLSAFVVLNHFVAAFDAAISAKLHNNRVDADVRLSHDPFGRPRVTTSLTYTL